MDNTISDYLIQKNDGYFVITYGGKEFTTPNGSAIKNADVELLNLIIGELKINKKADPSFFGFYSVYCTYRDFFFDTSTIFSKDEFKKIIESDISLNTVAGPECMDQVAQFSSLTEMLEKKNILHTIFGWSNNFDKIVDHFYDCYIQLTPVQRACAVNSSQVHESMLYGIILAMGECTEKQYAMAIAAANAIIPGVFSDATSEELDWVIERISSDAAVLNKFNKLVNI